MDLKFTFFILFQMLSMAVAEDPADEDTADEEVTVAAAVVTVTEVCVSWFQC